MKRGDVVTVVAQGDFGKPRPAIVVQSDRLAGVESVIVCLLTSQVTGGLQVRLAVEPSPDNGLATRSEIMVEKLIALRRDRIGPAIGVLAPETLAQLDQRLAFVLGLSG